jgi:hypothetical protein
MATTTPRYVAAEFPTPEAARDAAVRAETMGFDANAIELLDGPGPTPRPAERRAGDVRPVARVANRAAIGAAIGTLVGILIGLGAWLVSQELGTGLAVGAAAIAGCGVVGGLAGTYLRLPVDQGAFAADELEVRPAPGRVAVQIRVADDTEAARARTALDGH